MTKTPLVSILIPCYNHETFLPDCLNGLLQQTYENIELLICDDCSPDDSYQVIRQFVPAMQARFARVEVLRNETNCGVTRNINRMLAMAEGEYIKILASDDSMLPEAIEQLVAYFSKNPQCSVAVANGLRVPEDQHYPDFVPMSRIYEEAPDFSPEDFFTRVARLNCIFAPGAMVRRSVYETHGFYDETIPVEDMEYWLRLLKTGSVYFGYVDQPLIYYRSNSNSMSSVVNTPGLEKRRRRMHFAVLDTLEKHKDGFAPGVYEEVALSYIMNERGFAIHHKLKPWAMELRKQMHRFPGWKALPAQLRRPWRLRMLKMDIRDLLPK